MPDTMRVRIACIVVRDDDGTLHYNAAGWTCDGERETDDMLVGTLADAMPVGAERRCWIEADVPVPAELDPVPIEGEVSDA